MKDFLITAAPALLLLFILGGIIYASVSESEENRHTMLTTCQEQLPDTNCQFVLSSLGWNREAYLLYLLRDREARQ